MPRKKTNETTSSVILTEVPTAKESKKSRDTKSLSMEELLKKYTFRPPKKGDEIEAKIISISRRQTLFDIGWKSYAVLGELEARELSTYLPYLKVGDTVRIRVVVEEAKDGYPVVSMKRFFEKGKWDILIEKQEKEQEIEVLCGEYGRGGLFIDFMGIRGVVPKIQLAEEYIENPEKLSGQKIKVKVLEVDQGKNRLVVSQKAVTLGISYKDLRKEFDEISIGGKYKARVIGFSEFGVFCEVGGIEGLIHISEISWAKVVNPRTYIKIGDELDVIVVEKNPANFKLNLSIKRLTPDPWLEVEKEYPPETLIKGAVMRKEKYGYIVRLREGIEGLIHISKITSGGELKVDEPVNVYIEKIDVKNRRISLIPVSHEKPVAYR